ncbi:MAG: hypothetical protein U0166_02640 [Acidobacteriota bacterium]
MGIPESIAYLRRVDMGGASSAVDDLRGYAIHAAQAEVYQRLFPRQFRERRGLLAPRRGGTRVIEVELLQMLEPMVPIDEAALEMVMVPEEEIGPLGQIPVRPWFPHDEEVLADGAMDFAPGPRLAALLSWRADACWIADGFHIEGEIDPIAPASWNGVRRVFGKERAPIRYFIDAVAVVNRETDTIWWDGPCACGGGCGCGLPWDVSAIRAVAAQRRRAEAIDRRIERLNAWLTRSGPEGVRTLLKLWNEAARHG